MLSPRRLIPAFSSGLIAAAVYIPLGISLASLIFSGSLGSYLPNGIGFFLIGSVLYGVIVALTSSFPASIAVPQDAPAVLLALVANGLFETAQASSRIHGSVYASVVATIALTSLLVGVAYILLGVFKLGDMVRFIPYPVIGGFLAGTGYLICRGALGVMTGMNIEARVLLLLMQSDMLLLWLPGLIFGLLLLFVTRRWSHFLIIPGMVVGAIALAHLGFGLAGMSAGDARSMGLLLGPFPQGGLWRPITPAMLGTVDWHLVLSQWGGIATVVVLCVVSLLLNASGLELAARSELDLNRELRAQGLANLAAGIVGSPPGFMTLSLSMFGQRLRSNSRLNGVIFALACGITAVFGAPLLSFMPKLVLGGLLFYLGAAFLVEWLYDGWFKLSRADYLVVLAMLATVAVLGPLEGVALGVGLSAVMFIFEYSKINVIKHTFTSRSYQSRVERSPDEKAFLQEQGDWLFAIELQGFLFFGTADRVVRAVRSHLEAPHTLPPRMILIDFRRVTGLDASAAISFEKLKQLAQPKGVVLVFSALSPAVERKLKVNVLTSQDSQAWQVVSDLDHAIEWCEDAVLGKRIEPDLGAGPATLSRSHIALVGLLRSSMRAHLQQVMIAAGETLIQQGDTPKGLYFIDFGRVSAVLEMPDGGRIRLRSMGPGNVVGELGLYLNQSATASVVADTPAIIYFLPGEKLKELEETEPKTASELHRFMLRLVSERLVQANETVRALSE